MSLLYSAAGRYSWITVSETGRTRSLHLNGCEEGAMHLVSEAPVFEYLWFHKCSVLAGRPLRRALVLGAGAFTTAKCLALDYPGASIDVVDCEQELEALGRQFFRLDRPEFARIKFRGQPAEDYLQKRHRPYDFVFDDLFDGYQHVPRSCRDQDHFQRLRQSLARGGLCVKNVIWHPFTGEPQISCTDAGAALAEAFPNHAVLALGDPARGHNRLLIGLTSSGPFEWEHVCRSLAHAGVPEKTLNRVHPLGD